MTANAQQSYRALILFEYNNRSPTPDERAGWLAEFERLKLAKVKELATRFRAALEATE